MVAKILRFSSHFRNLVLVVLGNEVTKILRNSLFTFFTQQGKTGKNRTHGNENLATYFWYFGSFDKKTNLRKYVMSQAFEATLSKSLQNNFRFHINQQRIGCQILA